MTDNKSRRTYSAEHKSELHRIFTEAANQTPNNRQTMSMRDLIGDLKDDIHNLRQSGYTIDEICELITGGGVEAAPSTLRRYVSAATGKRRTRRRDAKARPNPTTPAPDTGPRAGAEKAAPGDETTSANTRRGEFQVTPDRDDL